MIETIAPRAGLGLRRRLGRYLAARTARFSLSPSIDIARQRKRLDTTGKRLPLARGVSVARTVLGGRPALALTPAKMRPGALVYLHGGGYSRGSPQSHKPLISRLAASFELKTFAPDYRLAPENPFPAGLDDAVAAIRAAREETGGPIVLAGDSAGGGLALAAAIRLRQLGLDLPEAMILFSPWTDLSLSGESVETKADADPMLKPDFLRAGAALYLGGRRADDPAVSPLFADLSGLPPTLIQAGGDEVLLDDSTRLAERMEAAGVNADCEVWQGLWHDFQLFAPIIPEADWAVDRARVWLDVQLADFFEDGAAPQANRASNAA
ncbi:alpha/beta hydrolase [Glycocaulis profundi]|nr:alpha/beta hydrolase [Glycocaulis profundi]